MYFVLLLSDTAKKVTLSEIILKMVQKNAHLAFCEVQAFVAFNLNLCPHVYYIVTKCSQTTCS